MKRTVISYRCSCGSACEASSVPPDEAERIVASYKEFHVGDGHHEVTRDEYKRIRAQQRRDEDRLLREAR